MLNSLRNLLLVVVAVNTFDAARAFQPALTEVEALLTTNGYSRTVHYQVYDPFRQAWQERTHRYDGSSLSLWTLTPPSIANGVVRQSATFGTAGGLKR